MISHKTFVTFFTLLVAAACAGIEERPDPPAPGEIVALARNGMAAQDIIKRMAESHAVYRLPASQLARLREQGVPDEVIDYMNNSHLEAVRREEARRQFDRDLFYGGSYFPYYRYPYGPMWSPYWWR